MITRTFHPIGQGAFYSEKHEYDSKTFTIVYDCGCLPDNKIKDEMIKNAFAKNAIIDILFISHFDLDHVSKISILKSCTTIKRVIMPLLHDDETILLKKVYNGVEEMVDLIENPESFFGESTNITKVRIANDTINNEDPNLEILEANQLPLEIKSGTRIKLEHFNWVLIPSNYQYENRRTQLISLLKKKGINTDRLIADSDYAIKMASRERKLLKDIYQKVDGTINQNSMLVYSGPNQRNNHEYQHFHWWKKRIHIQNTYCCKYCNLMYDRVACIYTGDADLNITKIEDIYNNLWMNVGTVQISHHGAFKSFNESFLEEGPYICPISFGEKNIYNHPSSAIVAKIVEKGSITVYITDREHTVMVEIINATKL